MRRKIKISCVVTNILHAVKILSCFVSFSVLTGCSFTQQTPTDVGQRFQEGIQGKGRLLPSDQDNAPNTGNSPVTQPAGGTESAGADEGSYPRIR